MAPSPVTQAPRVGELLREARLEAELGQRELARRAGVSHTQITRIESGQVSRPSRDVLVGVARGLNRNPVPLLIVAGHLTDNDAKESLKTMFREGSELAEIWSGCSDVPLERVQRLLREDAGDQDLRAIAADAFRVQESDETLWDDLYSVLGGAGEVPAELRELIEIYRYLEPDYRRRWLENGRTFRRLTDLNYLLEAEVDEATTKLDFARRS